MVDPSLVSASIEFDSGSDGKEEGTTPFVTVQCKGDGTVVVTNYEIDGTGSWAAGFHSEEYGLQLTTAPATRSMLSGGRYLIRITTDGDDGWNFSPILRLLYNDGSLQVSAGSEVRLVIGEGQWKDHAEFQIQM